MTKKHFIALADMIINEREHYRNQFPERVIDALAEFCTQQNPRFNRERWIAYINGECGKNGGKVKQAINA